MSRMIRSAVLIPAILLLAVPAFCQGFTAYVPHITKGDPVWQDFLLATNLGTTEEMFSVAYYDQGTLLRTVTYPITLGEQLLIDLKQESAGASLAVITYASSRLNFRQVFRDTANGLAEFALADNADYQIAFQFSNVVGPNLLAWSGLALANIGDKAVNVDLYALDADGIVIGTVQQALNKKSRVVGTHDFWFPGLNKNDIAQIVARSDDLSKICGIVISGTADAARLLFTQALPQPAFTPDPPANNEVDLGTLFPDPRYQLYTLSTGDWLRILRVTAPIGPVGFYLEKQVGSTAYDFRGWTLEIGSQNITFKGAFESLVSIIPVADPIPIAPRTVTLPYSTTLNTAVTVVLNGANAFNTSGIITVDIDGPWYFVSYAGPVDAYRLSIGEESFIPGIRRQATFWLAKNLGFVKLISDGQEYVVTGIAP